MKKDRMIKQQLQSEFVPEKTFEQFCRENNLSVAPAPKKPVRTTVIKALFPAACAAVLVAAIVLPIALKDDNVIPNTSQTSPALAVHSDVISIEEMLADSEFSMLNTAYMFDEYTSFRKMYVDGKPNEKRYVGYSVDTDVYGANIYGKPYVYGFTLTTAKRNVLSDLDKHLYYGCDSTETIGDVNYSYKITEGLTVGMFVYYQIGKYEYCITVEPLGTAAIADKEYMQVFLQLAFGQVEGAEPLNIADYLSEVDDA